MPTLTACAPLERAIPRLITAVATRENFIALLQKIVIRMFLENSRKKTYG
jgi:hypothetical protein